MAHQAKQRSALYAIRYGLPIFVRHDWAVCVYKSETHPLVAE